MFVLEGMALAPEEMDTSYIFECEKDPNNGMEVITPIAGLGSFIGSDSLTGEWLVDLMNAIEDAIVGQWHDGEWIPF